jgi:purine-nucleoside phosphorylase
MSRPFDAAFKEAALNAAASLGLRLERGVYVGVLGPCLETPAETRAFKRLGGDAVGMSTVLEVIAARHMGLRLLGLSCLTNKNLPDCMEETSFEEVVQQANRTGPDLRRLLNEIIPRL